MFHVVGTTYSVNRAQLEKVAKAAFSFLTLKTAEIELKFVTEAEITRLNSVYRGKASATDVLSFIVDDKPLLGQVFICYNFTKAQAKAMNKTLDAEVALLLTHGILHVAGYDHEDEAGAQAMEDAEKQILEKVGLTR